MLLLLYTMTVFIEFLTYPTSCTIQQVTLAIKVPNKTCLVLLQAATNPNPVAMTTANLADPKNNPSSRWSKIKIVTKQAGDECITAIEIVPPVEGAERHSIPISRPRTVARKFASIARSQVKRKRQMAAREKKVC